MHLLLLPNELLSAILDPITPTRQSTFPLLLVCKAFYEILYPKLWRKLSTCAQEYIYYTHRSRQRHGLRKLVHYAATVGLENIRGLKYVKEIAFNSDEDFSKDGVWDSSGLLEVMTELIHRGDITLKKLVVTKTDSSSSEWQGTPAMINFLKTLKSNPPADITIHTSYYNTDTITLPLNLFHPPAITSLTLHHHYPNYDSLRDSTISATNIPHIISLLSNLPSLQLLILDLRYTPTSITYLHSPDLESLFQSTISNLPLHTLGTISILFNPSFYLHPPPSTKSLTTTQTGDKTWWEQFSRHPLPLLEELAIFTPPAHSLPDDGTHRYNFSLTTLEITSLRRLHNLSRLQTPQLDANCEDIWCPENFLDLVCANNPNLDASDREYCLSQSTSLKKRIARLDVLG
ncbi:hypothetical protein TWF481_005611 [Arthrobotrys musiformis]|uniref:F-box domain-containing protein n=1 Tax=Arthrobotrys musiformis TaxID=47236 RepID=A0AAV9WK04_9PEZI